MRGNDTRHLSVARIDVCRAPTWVAIVGGAGLPMPTRFSFFITASLLIPGCFSPKVDAETDGTDSSDGSSAGVDTESPSTSMVTTDDPQTTADPTTDGPTTDGPSTTNGPSTTDGPSTSGPATTDDSSSSGGPSPFCGDGNLDLGEDCDDGDGNGLDQACLPDCNLNVCGDGNLGPDEVCDDGADDNILEVGACAPDCSTVIEEKVIRLSSTFGGGNYQPNPVGFADSQCTVGYRALFTVPGVRQATNGTPNSADSLMDWPLQPYTAYVRNDGTPIWITDETPLLGVRGGTATDLVNSIYPVCEGDVSLCLTVAWPVVTGMAEDWTPILSDTCNGWSTNSDNFEFQVGEKTSVNSFLQDGSRSCATATGDFILLGSQPIFYCVEQ